MVSVPFFGPFDRPPIDFAGPPDPLQLVYFFVVAGYFWIQGWSYHRRTRERNPVRRTRTPRWVNWCCGEFDPRYAVDPAVAFYYQLPQVIMSVLALCGYVFLPTAGLFGWFLGIPLAIFWGIIFYLSYWKRDERDKRDKRDEGLFAPGSAHVRSRVSERQDAPSSSPWEAGHLAPTASTAPAAGGVHPAGHGASTAGAPPGGAGEHEVGYTMSNGQQSRNRLAPYRAHIEMVLREGGWFPEREIDMREYVELLEGEGYTVFPAVHAFLQNYGGLTFAHAYQSSKTGQIIPIFHHFDIDVALIDAEQLADCIASLPSPACLIGEADNSHTLLLMTDTGQVYECHDGMTNLLAYSGQEAIEFLIASDLLRLSNP